MIRNVALFAAVIAMAIPSALCAAELTPAQQALWQRANKECNSPKYPSGARPVVNYAKMTFKCVEPGSSRH